MSPIRALFFALFFIQDTITISVTGIAGIKILENRPYLTILITIGNCLCSLADFNITIAHHGSAICKLNGTWTINILDIHQVSFLKKTTAS